MYLLLIISQRFLQSTTILFFIDKNVFKKGMVTITK